MLEIGPHTKSIAERNSDSFDKSAAFTSWKATDLTHKAIMIKVILALLRCGMFSSGEAVGAASASDFWASVSESCCRKSVVSNVTMVSLLATGASSVRMVSKVAIVSLFKFVNIVGGGGRRSRRAQGEEKEEKRGGFSGKRRADDRDKGAGSLKMMDGDKRPRAACRRNDWVFN